MLSFPSRRVAIALAVLALAACSTDSPVAPGRTTASAPLASKQSTTSSTILFSGSVEAISVASSFGVFSMNDDGTGIRLLTGTGAIFSAAAWAPDGKRVLFTKGGAADIYGSPIAVMNADGTGITTLTAPPSNCGDVFPVALGKQIVFDRACTDANSIQTTDLYLMNADGTALTRLASGVERGSPAPSPKGNQVVFEKWGDLWLLDIGTNALTNLTQTGALSKSNPAFSPSGKQIAYNQDGAIFVMNADGSAVTQLTSSGSDFNARWSPDGKRIAFTRLIAGALDVLVMNADGTGVTNLTQGFGAYHSVFAEAWTRY